MTQSLYAFWKYDNFQKCLGGEVKSIEKNGLISTHKYDGDYYFKPFIILPIKEGLDLQKKFWN